MYNNEELESIRKCIMHDIKPPTEKEKEIVKTEILAHPENHIMLAMMVAPLIVRNNSLYQKIMEDEQAYAHVGYGFFPETYPLCYGLEESADINLSIANRGTIVTFSHPTKNLIIKQVESTSENKIAEIAGDLGVGPIQYPSLEGFLTEEYVIGRPFSFLRDSDKSNLNIFHLGRRVKEILDLLHSREIFYNDVILTDDVGNSHLIVPKEGQAKLIDYGASILLKNHPVVTSTDVWNYARTLPEVNLQLQMSTMSLYEMKMAVVEHFLPEMKNLSKEEIINRDQTFIEEGVYFASYRIGESHVQHFKRGYTANLE